MSALIAALASLSLADISSFVWGPATLVLIAGTGLYLMVGLQGMPLRRLGFALKAMVASIGSGKTSDQSEDGEVNAFQGLMTALAATIGTGNVAGVAAAIGAGGPGAVFWMWIAALLGVATKYAECMVAVQYREIDALNTVVGGPMYAIRNGLGRRWGWLGVVFALFGTLAGFGIGNGVQAHELASVLSSYGVPPLATGIGMALITFVVIVGGIRRIGRVAGVVVPVMAGFYVISALVILLLHISEIPAALQLIVQDAFTGRAAAGGAVGLVIQKGIARGVFSNEAGLGTAPIAQASARPGDPVLQGAVAMLGTVIDTLIICTMTALVIVISGRYLDSEQGVMLTKSAFDWALPGSGHLVSFATVTFTATTILGWSFYSERCLEFLAGVRPIRWFRLIWVAVVVIGATASFDVVWLIADILNGLMAIPNLLSLLLLSPVIFKLTRDYNFNRSQAEE
ncbi:sodium:alanine symporter family protein [Synechococcus sp. CS-197]|uniref:alanine/glycine:cation symporter family protein n=1 Tax=Synechococcus sp. CS-197 TaxID=2847985 RepID=UPI0001525A27|nr:amino acid carrier protein [Synechococcus sp. CS-197]MCT0250583.1 sodium:alanine symporter family protein [Synechococcus sp. CS-197]CAK23857.1 Na+/alanine symporter [Synechococcus sp. WH 7803]